MIFSNRDLAIGIWIFIIAIWVLSNKTLRQSFVEIIKIIFVKQIIIMFVLMLSYILFIIWLLNTITLWDSSQLKNTIYWCMSVAVVTMFRMNAITKDEHFFKNAIFDNVKILLVLEFIINVYSLSLWLELILIPLLAILTGVLVIAESKEKYKQLEEFINTLMMIIGIIFLLYAGYRISTEFNTFATTGRLMDFILPPVLSIIYLPFVYFVALLMTYENLFVRLGFYINDPDILRYVKLKTFVSINVNLSKLKLWSNYITKVDFSDKSNINLEINKFNHST
jgi:hypothetical protein